MKAIMSVWLAGAIVIGLPAPVGAEDDSLRGAVRGREDSVDIFGLDREFRDGARQFSPGPDGRSPGSQPASNSGPRPEDEEPCFPRIRNIDGVDQPGHVCPDADGTLIWVPDTDAEAGGPGQAETPPLVVTAEEVQTLLVNAGTIQVQPDRSWVLVNAETIVHTDAAEHTLSTQVLGIDVDVRVTPTQFTWDFGDGSEPLTRTEPGAPWPDHTTAHKYQAVGDFQITLRTEWDAHFRAQGASAWQPVTGTPVTVAESEPFEAVTATPRLTR